MKAFNNRKIQILIIILVTFLVYSNIFANGFVWDDQFFIQEWGKLRSWLYLPNLLRGELPLKFSGAFRPLLGFFYLIFYQLFGQNPFGWHLQSILVHLINTLLVFLIAEKLLSKVKLMPFAVALIFGIHPIHTEAVTYIGASINSIGYLFFFSSFYFYLLYKEAKNITKDIYSISSILTAIAAFFTYELTLTLPLIIISYEMTLGSFKAKKLQAIYPYFIAVGTYLFIRIFLVKILGRGQYLLGSFPQTMLTMTKMFLKYLELLVLPLNQAIFHTLPNGILTNVYIDLKKEAIQSQSIFEPAVLLAILILVISLIWAYKSLKKNPIISFSIGWFYITLLPASNIIPVQELGAERYLYLPSFGFILLAVASLQLITGKFKNSAVILVLIFIISLTYGYLTFKRNQVWLSNYTLWLDTTKKTPLSEIAHFNLGNAYVKMGKTDLAIQVYKKAIENKKDSMGSYIQLGSIYHLLGKLDLALVNYQKALSIDPNLPLNYNNVGIVYKELGEDQKALEYFLLALLIDKNYPDARDNINMLVQKNPQLDIQKTLDRLIHSNKY